MSDSLTKGEDARYPGDAATPSLPVNVADQFASWQTFYLKVLGINISPETVRIPVARHGFDRLVFVAEALTFDNLWKASTAAFQIRVGADVPLHKSQLQNQRDPTFGNYCIRIRDEMENDNSEARACAYKWRQEGGQAMTLFERLLWELYHFRTTGQHAEFHRITLCAGTTDLTGNTFAVGWESDEAACWIWRWRMIDEDPAFAVADVLT